MAQLLCRRAGGVEEDAALAGAASPDSVAVSTLHIPRRVIIVALVRMRAQDTTGYLKSRSIFNHLLTKTKFLLDRDSWGFIINQPGLQSMFTAGFACSLIARCGIVTISYCQGSKMVIPAWSAASMSEKLVLNDLVPQVPKCDHTGCNWAVCLAVMAIGFSILL